jgi:hypothetical protein
MKVGTCLAALAALAMLGAAGPSWSQEDDATAAAESDAKEATRMATPSPSEMGDTSDGSSSSGASHTESSSSSTSFSVSVGPGPAPAPMRPPPAAPRPNPNSGAALNGAWKLATASGDRSCGLKLSEGDDTDQAHYAWTDTGGPDGSLGVNRWRYDGHTLTLTTSAGDVFGEFHRVGSGRFEGRNVATGEPLVITR